MLKVTISFGTLRRWEATRRSKKGVDDERRIRSRTHVEILRIMMIDE
jgi:hypothetical protein